MSPVIIGETGVDMFFLLSGFLIAYLLGREYRRSGSIHYCRFLFRRWLRIFPAFITAILLYSVVTFQACAHWGWTNVLFLNNFIGPQVVQGVNTPDSADAPCVGHSWSIAVEFQMYLVSPLLVYAMYRLGSLYWTVPVVGCILCMALRASLWAVTDDFDALQVVIYDKPYARCSPYLIGMLMAYLLGPALDQRLAAAKVAKAAAAEAAAAADEELVGGTTAGAAAGAGSAMPTGGTASGVGTALLSKGQSPPRPDSADVPLHRWAPVIYWVGIFMWVLLSWARAPGLGYNFVDRGGRGWPDGLSMTAFRTLYALGVGLALYGMMAVRLTASSSASAVVAGGRVDGSLQIPSGDPKSLGEFDEDEDVTKQAVVDPCACCPACPLGRWPASGASLAWFLELSVLIPIARLSYSIYLLQFIPMYLAEIPLNLGMDDTLAVVWAKYMALVVITLLASSVLSAIVYMLVEKPCMNMRERCAASRRG